MALERQFFELTHVAAPSRGIFYVAILIDDPISKLIPWMF